MSPITLPHPELSSKLCNLLSIQGKQARFNYLITLTGCSCKLQLFHLITYVKFMLNPKYKQELKWVLKIKKVSSIINCIIQSPLVSRKNKINVSVILLDWAFNHTAMHLLHLHPLPWKAPSERRPRNLLPLSAFTKASQQSGKLSGRYEKQSYLHLWN